MQRITTLWREQASLNPASQRIAASFACIAKDDAIEKNPQAIKERRKMGQIASCRQPHGVTPIVSTTEQRYH
ncbi:hypothetical protein BHM03_00035708 [Ensete ventricosum]|uniref:Uncharacterized protein n=1 Tax=Ensete ventricosum TaxID=4639 RepID=A0A427ALH9_ENSVE|nr:hypothetical protein B296_00016409 [Ensete ventricosum]RZS05229.1 hypothetical protein BHM03_00035708 [Ensete ventricosum]